MLPLEPSGISALPLPDLLYINLFSNCYGREDF